MMIVVERPHFVLEELVERAMNVIIATMGLTELVGQNVAPQPKAKHALDKLQICNKLITYFY